MEASTAICRLVLSFLSQFFRRRRHFSGLAKDTSTTHRFGSTAKVCSSLRLTTSTEAPGRFRTPAAGLSGVALVGHHIPHPVQFSPVPVKHRQRPGPGSNAGGGHVNRIGSPWLSTAL